MGFYQSRKRGGNRKRLLCFLKAALQCAQFLHTFRYPPGNFNNKTKTHADPYRINVRLQYRSGETRTRDLLLPKQARYQLRNTPIFNKTPLYYSILGRFRKAFLIMAKIVGWLQKRANFRKQKHADPCAAGICAAKPYYYTAWAARLQGLFAVRGALFCVLGARTLHGLMLL